MAQYTVVPSAVIAKTGDAAIPGRPGFQVFSGFIDSPVVNSNGRVVFMAQTAPAVGSPNAGTSIWSDRSGALAPVSVAGDSIAPESNDPTRAWAGFTSSTGLFIADNGRLVVASRGTPAFPNGSYFPDALMASDLGGDWSFIAINGQVYPNSIPVPLDAWLGSPAVRADNGRVAFTARHPNGSRYFLLEEDAGLVSVDSSGSRSPTSENPLPVLADTGDFIHTAEYFGPEVWVRGRLGASGPQLTQTGQTITFVNAPGQWVFSPENDTPGLNGAGEYIIRGTLHAAAGGPELAAAVRFTGQGAVLLARQGDPVPGSPSLMWNTFTDFWCLSDAGTCAWRVTLSGPGVTDQNETALVVFSGGDAPQATIISREGDPVDDLPGFTYGSTHIPSMTASGRVAFSGSVRDTQGGFASKFTTDAAGRIRLLTAAGQSSIVLPSIGAVQVASTFGISRSGGNDGLVRNLTTDGRAAVRVTYAGGQAIVLLPVPCPADIAGAGAVPGFDGQMDNNDFIVFIDHFFNADRRADYGSAGGVNGPDGLFDNNDFIAFIGEFFDGCS